MSSSRAAGPSGAKQRLMTELSALQKEKWVRFEDDMPNLFRWKFALMVINSDSDFNGGYFKAEMIFPEDYPYSPPRFKFLLPIYHPNIYPDGQLCISILHKPGEDVMSGEAASERWSPLQGVESVLRSVLLLLDDPEINSPANVDASVTYRDKREAYQKRAKDTVERSRRDIPEGFVMPTSFEATPPPAGKTDDDDGFWAASDEEDFDFGGSDTEDGDMEFEDEDDEDEEDVKLDKEERAERRRKREDDSDDEIR